MAIAQQKKIYIFMPRDRKEEVFREIQKHSLVHIEPDLRKELEEKTGEPEPYAQEVEQSLMKAGYILEFLEPYEKPLPLMEKIEKSTTPVPYKKFESIKYNFDLNKIYDICYEHQRAVKELESSENELNNRVIRLDIYKESNLDLQSLKGSPLVVKTLGSLGDEVFEVFCKEMNETTPLFHIEEIARNVNRFTHFLLIYHREERDKVEKVLHRYNFHPEDMKWQGSVEEELQRIENRKLEIQSEKEKLVTKIDEYLPWLDNARLLYDYLLAEKDRRKAESWAYETRYTALIKGWVKTREIERLEGVLKETAGSFHIQEVEPNEEDIIPIELRNPGFVRPLEMITTMYGSPNYKEFDPTPIFFIFFIMFFGICLGDGGYGVLLSIASLMVIHIMKLRGDAKKLLMIVFYGGLMSMVFGFLTGSWFSIERAMLPRFLQELAVFDINSMMVQFLALTFYLGATQMVVGLLSAMILYISRGDFAPASEKLFWALFFGCGTPMVIQPVLLTSPIQPPISHILTLIINFAFLGLVLLKFFMTFVDMPKEDNPVKIMINFFVTFLKAVLLEVFIGIAKPTIDFFANVMSYSRLMALCLAGGGIAFSVNTFAGLISSSLSGVPVLGFLASALIMVVGHFVNILLCILGGMVHTSRLQYVEFFPYFFEGGGKPWSPLSIESKYNIISNE